LNVGDRGGAKTLEGSPCPLLYSGAAHGWGRAETDRDSGAPVSLAACRRANEARERRRGEIPAKVFAGEP
jgi:hypothetical protein